MTSKLRRPRHKFDEGGLATLRALADKLGTFLPGMGGPSTEDISNMSPEEYSQYQEDLAGAQERAPVKVRRIVGNAVRPYMTLNPETNETEFFAKNPLHMNRPELVDELVGLPAYFGQMFGSDMKDWPQSLESIDRTRKMQEDIQTG